LQLFAQETKTELLNKATLLYDAGEYEKVIEILKSVTTDTTITREEEINARTYLAFSFVAMDKKTEAKNQFIIILKKEAGFSLNPEFVSPKIMEVFNEAEKMIKKPQANNIIKIKKPPPGTMHCLIKSSLFPGWGQLTRREERKGKLLMGSFVVSITALALSQLAYLSAENSYENAVTKSDIDYQYSRYNFTYKTRYIISEITVFLWIYSVTDIFIGKGEHNSK